MRAEILNAFLTAASKSLAQEIKSPVHRTGLNVDPSDHLSDEVTIYVALVGEVKGLMLIGMTMDVARQIAGEMVGDKEWELSEMGLSALSELGNVIAGGSCIELESLGLRSDITPPTIMIGQRSRISTLGLPRFVIPLWTQQGALNINVAVDVQSSSNM